MPSFDQSAVMGIRHILDLDGYDHILFLVALSACYSWKGWRSLAWLATAFTVGHSVSLALAATDTIRFSSDWIEFLIPVTIVATAILNLAGNSKQNRAAGWRFFITAGFGLIHGMGFSSYFRMICKEGQGFASQLLAFNLGVEVGQLLILTLVLLLRYLLERRAGMQERLWTPLLSWLVLIPALWLCVQNARSLDLIFNR